MMLEICGSGGRVVRHHITIGRFSSAGLTKPLNLFLKVPIVLHGAQQCVNQWTVRRMRPHKVIVYCWRAILHTSSLGKKYSGRKQMSIVNMTEEASGKQMYGWQRRSYSRHSWHGRSCHFLADRRGCSTEWTPATLAGAFDRRRWGWISLDSPKPCSRTP